MNKKLKRILKAKKLRAVLSAPLKLASGIKSIISNSFRRLSSFSKKIRGRIYIWYHSENTKGYVDKIKFILIYGALSYLAVLSWFNFGGLNPINILGYGATIYLMMDFYKFYRETKTRTGR